LHTNNIAESLHANNNDRPLAIAQVKIALLPAHGQLGAWGVLLDPIQAGDLQVNDEL
jgi:hypothetical protein